MQLSIHWQGLAKYLVSDPRIIGFTESDANSLATVAEQYGTSFPAALADSPEQIAALANAHPGHVENLKRIWQRHAPFNEARTWLYGYGLKYETVECLINLHRETAVSDFNENPFIVLDLNDDTTTIAELETIGLQMDMPANANVRLKVLLKQQAERESKDGHCWTVAEDLIDATVERANSSKVYPEQVIFDDFVKPLDELIEEKALGFIKPKRQLPPDSTKIIKQNLESYTLVGPRELLGKENTLSELFANYRYNDSPLMSKGVPSSDDIEQHWLEGLNEKQTAAFKQTLQYME